MRDLTCTPQPHGESASTGVWPLSSGPAETRRARPHGGGCDECGPRYRLRCIPKADVYYFAPQKGFRAGRPLVRSLLPARDPVSGARRPGERWIPGSQPLGTLWTTHVSAGPLRHFKPRFHRSMETRSTGLATVDWPGQMPAPESSSRRCFCTTETRRGGSRRAPSSRTHEHRSH
jgi:hypothetical protein